MRGPKSAAKLRSCIRTADGHGGFTEQWFDVCTFKAVLVPLKVKEKVFTDKETVFADFRLMMDYRAIPAEDRSEVSEQNQIGIGTQDYKIKGVTSYHNRHWELDLLVVK